VRLYYDTGWSNTWSTVNYAKDRKVIPNNTAATKKAYLNACELLKWEPGFAGSHGPADAEGEGETLDADLELTGVTGDED
jgi:hypothetical protein